MELLFDNVGFNHVWENQNSFNKNCLTYAIYKNLDIISLNFGRNPYKKISVKKKETY